MPVQEVACGRDVRAPRLLPSSAQLLSKYGLRRVVSVGTLLTIDAGSFVLALALVTRATGMGWTLLWPGLKWWSIPVAITSIMVVAATKGLYGRQYTRHDVRRVVSAWTIAFMAALGIVLVVNPLGIGARFVVVWLLGGALSLGSRFAYDLALSSVYGPDGDAPPALLLGSLDACTTALATLAALPHTSRVSVIGLVVPQRESDAAGGVVRAPQVVADDTHLEQALRDSGAVQVILADPASLNGRLRDIMDTCHDSAVSLKVVSPQLQLDSRPVTYIGGLDCPLFVVRPRPASAASYFVKRVGDRVGSAFLLVTLSPLLLVIACSSRPPPPGRCSSSTAVWV